MLPLMMTSLAISYTCLLTLCSLAPVLPFKCKSGTSLGKVQTPRNELICYGALIEKCSVVYTNNGGKKIWLFSCASSSGKCGDKVRDADVEMNYCCCEKEHCNDAAFAERCSSAGNVATASVAITVLLFGLAKTLC